MRPIPPKLVDVIDPEYLDWIRRRPCAFGCRVGGTAHHTIKKQGGCVVIRDDMTIPVCERHHMRCHGATISDGGFPAAGGAIHVHRQLALAAYYRAMYLAGRVEAPPVPF